jgi:hypothetical protein
MNHRAVWAIYLAEMGRTRRTLLQSVVSPVISTSLYFVVFGAAIGSRINEIEGVSYGAFIVPGLIMLMLLTQSVTNAAFGISSPKSRSCSGSSGRPRQNQSCSAFSSWRPPACSCRCGSRTRRSCWAF